MAEPGSSMNPVQGGAGSQSTRELAAGSPMSTKPQRPQRPQSLGEVGTTPSGSASPPPWVVPTLPAQLQLHLFTQLVEMGLEKQPRVDALAQEAFELVAAGHDVSALATQSIKLGLKSWCKPTSRTSKKESLHEQNPPVTQAKNQSGRRSWGGYERERE